MMQIIAGKHRLQKLVVPKGPHIRPTTGYLRECLFNICQSSIAEAFFLDLFAGCGAMGLEALSRGAEYSIFVEKHSLSIKSILQNIEKLGEKEHCQVIQMDVFVALELLANKKMSFDIIFADPPYHKNDQVESFSHRILGWLDKHPELLKPQGQIFFEDAKEGLNEENIYDHFILKSSRKMGISYLRQYILKKVA